MRKCLLFKSISVPDREIEICKIFFIPKNNKVGVSHLMSAILFNMLNRIFHITTIAFWDKSSSSWRNRRTLYYSVDIRGEIWGGGGGGGGHS